MRLWDLDIYREKWLSICKQWRPWSDATEWRHILWHLIWVCTVFQLPFSGSPNYNGSMRIISKSQAHLQTMTKNCTVSKDQHNTVGRVADARYLLPILFDCIWTWKMTKFKMRKKWQLLIWRLYPNHMHIFRPWQTFVQFQKDWHKTVGGFTNTRYILSEGAEPWTAELFKKWTIRMCHLLQLLLDTL